MVATSMETGGVQSVIRDLSEQLVSSGHECGILSLCGRDEVVTSDAVKRWTLGLSNLRGSSPLHAAFRLRDVQIAFQPDIVHAHAFHANSLASVAGWITRQSPPRVLTLHSVREGGWRHRLVARFISIGAGSVVAVSEAVRSSQAMGQRAMVIANGVDTSTYRFNSVARTRVRESLGIHSDALVLVTVGRLTEAKDHRNLIDAISFSRLRDEGATVLIVGEGPLREQLVHRTQALALTREIRFLGARTDVADLLSAADVYVQSSAWEGMPVAVLEAIASGLPVIATDVGGTRELSPAPDLLVPPANVEALARALNSAGKLLRRPCDRLLRNRMLSSHDRAAVFGRWLSLYKSLLRK